ncbi:MAG TPA: RcpC/CpaB family pilus assembly protein [Acidimicrobiales bacterium]|nr:RcpC/CpaB family pilus assembly protein [Acidimicrobiales bacterium]
MKRKIIGIVGAIALATLGTVALVAYVQSARADAVAGEELVDVWLVKSTVSEGTPAEEMLGSVEHTKVPAKLRAAGGVTDLTALKGLVTTTELLAGEQLIAARFVTPALARQGDVPAGFLQVTVELEPQRALGGRIRAGDTVAVLLSFEPFDLKGSVLESDGGVATVQGKTSNTTHLEFHKVLVTAVQIAEDASGVPAVAGEEKADKSDKKAVATAPTQNLLVTLAVDARALEQVVFAAEFGTVWLANEPADAEEIGTRMVDRGNVYDTAIKP